MVVVRLRVECGLVFGGARGVMGGYLAFSGVAHADISNGHPRRGYGHHYIIRYFHPRYHIGNATMTKLIEPGFDEISFDMPQAFFDGKPGLDVETKAILKALFSEKHEGECYGREI